MNCESHFISLICSLLAFMCISIMEPKKKTPIECKWNAFKFRLYKLCGQFYRLNTTLPLIRDALVRIQLKIGNFLSLSALLPIFFCIQIWMFWLLAPIEREWTFYNFDNFRQFCYFDGLRWAEELKSNWSKTDETKHHLVEIYNLSLIEHQNITDEWTENSPLWLGLSKTQDQMRKLSCIEKKEVSEDSTNPIL